MDWVRNYLPREKDIQRGGEGAPLAPIYHKTIMEELNLNYLRALLTLAESQILHIGMEKLIGFDTGPYNLMDKYINVKKIIL